MSREFQIDCGSKLPISSDIVGEQLKIVGWCAFCKGEDPIEVDIDLRTKIITIIAEGELGELMQKSMDEMTKESAKKQLVFYKITPTGEITAGLTQTEMPIG